MSMRNRVSWACLYAVATEDAPVVVDVVDASISFGTGNAMLCCILSRFDVDAIGRTSRRTQKTSNALLEAVLVTLQHMHTAIALLKFCAFQRPWTIWIVLYNRGLEHLLKSDAHALGDGRDIFNHWHTQSV